MHPYENLPPRAFWRSGVSEHSPLELPDIYEPRFVITGKDRIAAAGSCFAQHIGREFKRRKYNFIDMEPAPPGLPSERHGAFGFGLYSARYGNVYSARQLVQLFRRASGDFHPDETLWEDAGRFFDPFRPAIEPNGFSSEEEAHKDITHHLSMVESILARTDVFVFTFGLTESWVCTSDGAALPTCPGTVAGTYDAGKYEFVNFEYPEILADAEAFIEIALRINPAMRFLVTVSPVPLTATMSGNHVLPASVHSKSILRAVCGALYKRYECLDYFPSYEMVASHPYRAMFFDPNLRTVAPLGVSHVMNTFFAKHPAADEQFESEQAMAEDEDDVVCEEAILEEFAQ